MIAIAATELKGCTFLKPHDVKKVAGINERQENTEKLSD